MKIIKLLNPENAIEDEVQKWNTRESARGLVFDNEGKIAVLNVSKNNYYKLPGGGVDEGETVEQAFRRECLEEIGCEVEVISELGIVEEWRNIFLLKQTSYCFVGKAIGEKGEPNFTESKLKNGFEIVWMSAEEALDKLKNTKANNFEGENYIKPRDVAIVEEYLKVL